MSYKIVVRIIIFIFREWRTPCAQCFYRNVVKVKGRTNCPRGLLI